MTFLPPALGGTDLVGWRLDAEPHAATWDGGEGARRAGGRWNSKGVACVYASLDPATAILEVAVHKGFPTLDTVAHVLTAFIIADPGDVHIVQPADVPNPNWLRPGTPGRGQQRFGDGLLALHPFIAIPSAVCPQSWNLLFLPERAAGRYSLRTQDRFALDTRLNPP